MADYWKSNERKYCDFCNCWIADNKPSIAFHEGGKRHKANVAKRISDISKKSAKDEKAQQKVDQQMRQMEDAALRAYENDILRGGDMTTQTLRTLAAAETAAIEEASVSTSQVVPGPSALPARAIDPLMPPIDVLEDEERAKRERMKRKAGSSSGYKTEKEKEHSMWVEAKSPDGYTYYWNIKTGESIWEEPKEGYMTLEQYKRIENVVQIKESHELQKESVFMRENATELAAKYKREQLKQRRVKPTEEEVKKEEEKRDGYETLEEPGTAAQPYGRWQTIVHKEEHSVDLQLPITHEPKYVPTVSAEPEPVMRQFKEKTVVSLDDTSVPDSFKKRKFANKRNVRQRLDEDD